MTIHKATGTQIFISRQSPETLDAAGFEALEWTEIGGVNEYPSPTEILFIKTDNFACRGRIGFISQEYNIGKIKKKKRQRFGRAITFR